MIGYPCFRFRITGHYFALVTLALSEVVRLLIVALRDYTGGSLGVTPRTALADSSFSLYALQFADKEVWFYIVLAFWLGGLVIWRLVDRSMARFAMEAISQEEDAAAAVGIDVTRTKLRVTLISAAMTAIGGALYGQYQVYINPETVSGIAISLQIVFAVIAGGMFVQLGPTVGALFTLLLAESLRVTVGHDVHGLDGTIYGLMLVIFIIYMPKGILGKVLELWSRRGSAAPPGRLRPPPKRRSDPANGRRGRANPRAWVNFAFFLLQLMGIKSFPGWRHFAVRPSSPNDRPVSRTPRLGRPPSRLPLFAVPPDQIHRPQATARAEGPTSSRLAA